MDNQLMLGILLIIVGVAMGLIAVALVLNRREDRIAAELSLEEGVVEQEDSEDNHREIEAHEEEEIEDEVEEPAVEETEESEAGPRERHLVAEVYREEVTGRLIVVSGDHEYTDSKQIKNEGERRRLAYAASDLSDWFQGEFEYASRPAAAAPQQAASSDQMLEEINEILQRSLAGTPDRGVRLFPDAVGGVKVLVGVKSYEIKDVPDEEIRDLIRQAVAEWEAKQ